VASSLQKLKDVIGIDSVLNKIQDLDILLERILLEARRVVSADAGSIYVKRGDRLAVAFAQNDTKQAVLKPGEKLIFSVFTVPIATTTIAGYAGATGEIVNVRNAYEISESAPYGFDASYDAVSGYKTVSVLAVPLKTNMGDMLGVLQLLNKKDTRKRTIPFSKEDEIIAAHFATNATVALQRAKMTREILLRMTAMAELRDPTETGVHVNRVAGYSLEIYERWAVKTGIPPKQIERTRDIFRMATMLHDVGKVAISDLILKKRGRLTPAEYEIMKTHTWQGARLFLDKQSEFDEVAQAVALNHHENWDGSGYPGHVDIETGETIKKDTNGRAMGKKGKEIPVMGRIAALADVYDALSSKRVYKPAWTEEETLREMRSMSGTKFDPELVDIFFDVLPSIKTISAKFKEEEPEEHAAAAAGAADAAAAAAATTSSGSVDEKEHDQ
jgi:HD-GYP domain-containing protein (c-di-GMP phosphodiesterase class II)